MSSKLEKAKKPVENLNLDFEKSEVVIQNKDRVLRNLEKIDRKILEFTQEEVAKLDSKKKIEILEAFGDQTVSSGLSKILRFYKSKLKEGKKPDDTDEVISKLLGMVNNYKITDLKLESVMDGVLARGTSERALDFKKNLDVSLGGVAEMNDKAWAKTRGFMEGYMDKLKDAPIGVKGVMLTVTAFASLVGYYALTAKNEKTNKTPLLSKIFKFGLVAFGGFAAGNLLSDLNKREAPNDYKKLNKLVKAKDYAEFFLKREPNDIESRNAGAFIESVYNERIHQIEFSELIDSVKTNKADSSEWVNLVDGKGVDVAATHAGIDMFIKRYDPSYSGPESIYGVDEVEDKVKLEMKSLWEKVSMDNAVGNELTYRDVVLRFLALDPKFTFNNDRHEGNERYEIEEKYENQNKQYKELERISGLDFATGWLKETFNDPELSEILNSAPFSEEIASVWPDFMGLYHRAQGEISDIWVNIDEISDEKEFEKYREMSNDQKFSLLKKRISFKESIKLDNGSKITMKQAHEPSDGSMVDYENSFAVPNRKKFFEDFEIKDLDTGKTLEQDSTAIKYITLAPNKKETSPERIILPENVEVIAKKSVDLSKYVLYGYSIKFS